MPAKKRFKTKYPGVCYIEGKTIGTGKKERIYYILYRKDGRQIEERVGRQFQDSMTPARAARERYELISGKKSSKRKALQKKAVEKGNDEHVSAGSLRRADYPNLLKEKWLLFMEVATEGFALLDTELRLIEINDAGVEMFPKGTTKKDLLGKNLLEIAPNVKLDGTYENFMEVLKTGKPYTAEDYAPPTIYGENVHIHFKAFNVSDGLGLIASDITKLKRTEKDLETQKVELETKNKALGELNTALKVLLEKKKNDESEVEEKVLFSLNELVMPYMEKLKQRIINREGRDIISIVEMNLKEIVSPFSKRLFVKIAGLTSTETRVVNLVKRGKTTKEIAEVFNVSIKTIDRHRFNIRKKIGINNKKTNLTSYLSAIE